MTEEASSQDRIRTGKTRIRRLAARLSISLAIVYVIVLVLGFAFQKHFIYSPKQIDPLREIPVQIGDVEVWMEVPGVGRIHGLYHEATTGTLTVLFLHGNTGNIFCWNNVGEIFDGLKNLGLGILMIDYPGYGKSEGSPSEEVLYASSHVAKEFLLDSGIKEENLVIFGKSLGSAIAVELATTGEFAGLILESPFSDLPSSGQAQCWFLPVSFLLKEKYDTLSRIPEIRCPMLVIIGTKDTIVTPTQSQEVFDKAKTPKEMVKVEGAGHNDIQTVGSLSYWNKLREWFAGLR